MLNGIYESLKKAEEILSPFKQIEEIATLYKAKEGTTPSAVNRSVLSKMLLSFAHLNNLLWSSTGADEVKQMNDTIKEMTESVSTLTDLSTTSAASLDRTIAGVKAIPETAKALGPAKEEDFTSTRAEIDKFVEDLSQAHEDKRIKDQEFKVILELIDSLYARLYDAEYRVEEWKYKYEELVKAITALKDFDVADDEIMFG
jgi:hypothetical protein